jgi:stage V sporulation protein D (sporulation-specific penicillin-binding protein)
MTKRIGFVFCILLVSFAIVLARLFYWQVLRHTELKALAISQSSNTLTIPSKRGDILTSDDFPLATTKKTYLLYANPKVVTDRDEYADKISRITEVPTTTISAQLKKELYWVKLSDSITAEQKKSIEKFKLPGVGFEENNLRYYPESSMSAHLVGFLGKNQEGENTGYFGLEGMYDTQLTGRPGRMYAIHDALGNLILNDIRREEKIDGRSLRLSVDRTVQFIAEKKLLEGVQRYEADSGNVIVMESKTGRIVGMASFPQFAPETYYEFDPDSYKNPIVSNVYEPGSTFKVLIAAAAIDEGVIKPDTRCDICAGPVQVGEYSIKTWNDKYYADSTMTEVIQHSDNTGMVYMGRKLGLDKTIQYLEQFGINETTGIDLQGEISGSIRPRDSWYPIDAATVTFGQGISVTPMQLIVAVNAIANEGKLVVPTVVSEVITEEGKIITIKPKVKRQVISSTTAQVVKEMMVNAVDNGEAKWTVLKDYKVAGKTGTAQIPVEGRYDPNNTIASFVGFFPADDPKLTMLVTMHRPKTSIYGSETAAPIFFQIAREVIHYYNIPPTY